VKLLAIWRRLASVSSFASRATIKRSFFCPAGRVTGGVCLLIGLFPAFMMAFVAVTEKGKILSRQTIETSFDARILHFVTKKMHVYQVRPRKDHRGVDLFWCLRNEDPSDNSQIKNKLHSRQSDSVPS
jgi:hypothetical protein